jgi:serine/threonine protein kinase
LSNLSSLIPYFNHSFSAIFRFLLQAYEVLLKKGYTKAVDWWSLGAVLFESALGYPPFWGQDPVATCRKILRYKESLKFPEDRCKHLSPQCIDFLRRLMSDADSRLGAHGGVQEVLSHPFLRGIDVNRLRHDKAPYQPPNGPEIASLFEKLSSMAKTAPEFPVLLRRLTSCFDDFSNLPPDDPRHAFPGGGHGVGTAAAGGGGGSTSGSRFKNRFVGYTYKRGSDGKLVLGGPRMSDPSSAAAAAAVASMGGADSASGGSSGSAVTANSGGSAVISSATGGASTTINIGK